MKARTCSVFLIPMIIGISISLFNDSPLCRTLKIDGNRIVDSITIDGKLQDWYNVGSTYLNEEQAGMSFGNDDQNIYILFKTRDARWAQTIRITGLTIYLNAKGKKDKDFYLKFKGGATMDEIAAISPETKERFSRMPAEVRQRMEERAVTNQDELILYIKDQAQRLIDLNGVNGPSAAYDTSQGFFVYEFQIPLAETNDNIYGLDAESGNNFAIGAEWGDMGDFARKPEGSLRPGGGFGGGGGGMPPGGGGGMPPGGGMGGGRPPGGGGMGGHGGNRPKMPEKQEVWIETKLLLANDEGSSK